MLSTSQIVLFGLSSIGFGLLSYGSLYLLSCLLFDCDLQLAFLSIFGKSPKKLKGKVVFITGASSGIGEHTAKAFAKHGVKLVLTARREAELQRVKEECIEISQNKLNGEDILLIPFDMTNLSIHQEVFDQAVNHFGTVDILINNAGRSQRALFETIDIAIDKQMFELNVFSVVNLSRIAINYFNRVGKGHIAVVSSVAGVLGAPNSATYTATKHALHGYFNALRIEKLQTNIAVTLLCPGPTYTNFLQNCYTGKDGEKYGISASKTDRRLTGERCGELCAIALANRTNESWMGVFPMMPITYIAVYFPIFFDKVTRLVGPNVLFKFRDGKKVDLEQKKD